MLHRSITSSIAVRDLGVLPVMYYSTVSFFGHSAWCTMATVLEPYSIMNILPASGNYEMDII